MRRVAIVAFGTLILASSAGTGIASASDDDVHGDATGFTVHSTDDQDLEGTVNLGGGTTVELNSPSCELDGPHVCRPGGQTCDNGEGLLYNATFDPPNGEPYSGNYCVTEGEPFEVVTPGMVLEAFQHIPLPDSELVLDPEVDTYVNFETIFSTEAEPFVTSVTLLGQRVTLDIEPSSFAWDHADGTAQTTDTPGLAWRKSVSVESGRYITYAYPHDGRVSPSVDTTWSARYRVGGGPWLEVPGTVTIDGDPVPLTVKEAPPELHGAD